MPEENLAAYSRRYPGQTLMILNAAVYCTLVVRDTPIVLLR
jgi:hypothetical protein